MIKKLLPILFLLAGAAAGIAAGHVMKPPVETAAPGEVQTHIDEGVTGDKGDSDNEFLKLSKQFVVPLLEGEHLVGLANLSLSLEAAPGLSDQFYSREPKLRDAFLRVLFDHANTGGFDGAFTMPGKLEPLRRALLETAQYELNTKDVRSVLIVDIARQDNY